MEALTQLAPIDQIAAALALAQGQLTNPPKTKTAHVGKYKYRYADLAEIIEHVRPTLAKHELAFVQLTARGEGSNTLVTRLLHKSGQYLESTYPLPAQAAAQEMGSAITYARRYSLCAILGIAADEDDDGSKATEAPTAGADRDKLIELMGESAVGNKALMDFCKASNLGEGRSTDDLPDASITKLVENWPTVVVAVKKQVKTTTPKEEAPKAKPEAPTLDLTGINPELAERMKAANVSKAALKAYYTAQRHLPETIEPEKLPASYLKALLSDANWKKALTHMNGDK
jgi:hypothetical protein